MMNESQQRILESANDMIQNVLDYLKEIYRDSHKREGGEKMLRSFIELLKLDTSLTDEELEEIVDESPPIIMTQILKFCAARQIVAIREDKKK